MIKGKFEKLKLHVYSNTINADTIFRLRKNSADTALTITIPALATGIFTVEAEVAVETDDLACYAFTTTVSGNFGFIPMLFFRIE
jgi:hypothetical protein